MTEEKEIKKTYYQGYWHFTDEKLLELKERYENEVRQGNGRDEWKLKQIYNEIIKRNL